MTWCRAKLRVPVKSVTVNPSSHAGEGMPVGGGSANLLATQHENGFGAPQLVAWGVHKRRAGVPRLSSNDTCRVLQAVGEEEVALSRVWLTAVPANCRTG